MQVTDSLRNFVQAWPLAREAASRGNWRVLRSLLGPAYRGLIKKQAKNGGTTDMALGYQAHFDWRYERDSAEIRRLYETAKASQWNGSLDLPWTTDVDPLRDDRELLPDSFMPPAELPTWSKLSRKEKAIQRHSVLSWMLSQFLHGEQGALFAAAQVTEAVPWLDAKLYGSTQVVDEGRHVEVFHTYLTTKLEKLYEINDNLYVVIDALMSDSRWDMKFLGMQIMIEGLALGAFGLIRRLADEPLLRELLQYIIRDEARHVHFGVLSLAQYYGQALSERERREREDWAFEVALLLRNRFMVHEFYEEFYAHQISRREWERTVLNSRMMGLFRRLMFVRLVPNLKRIGLLSARIRPRYEALGLLEFEHGKAAPELTAADLLEA